MSKMTKTIAALGVVAGLGVAALPLSSYAADESSKNVIVTANVSDTISLTTSEAKVDLGDIVIDGQPGKGSVDAIVSGNSGAYHLTIQASGDGSMVHMDNGVAAAGGAKIEGGTLTGTTSSWGYSLDNANFQAVPGSDKTADTITPKAGKDTTTIYFGAVAKGNQAAGVYQNTVTLTAVSDAAPAE